MRTIVLKLFRILKKWKWLIAISSQIIFFWKKKMVFIDFILLILDVLLINLFSKMNLGKIHCYIYKRAPEIGRTLRQFWSLNGTLERWLPLWGVPTRVSSTRCGLPGVHYILGSREEEIWRICLLKLSISSETTFWIILVLIDGRLHLLLLIFYLVVWLVEIHFIHWNVAEEYSVTKKIMKMTIWLIFSRDIHQPLFKKTVPNEFWIYFTRLYQRHLGSHTVGYELCYLAPPIYGVPWYAAYHMPQKHVNEVSIMWWHSKISKIFREGTFDFGPRFVGHCKEKCKCRKIPHSLAFWNISWSDPYM